MLNDMLSKDELLDKASTCLISRSSTIRADLQAKEAKVRSSIVPTFAVTNIWQKTPTIQRASSPRLATGSRSAHYTLSKTSAPS